MGLPDNFNSALYQQKWGADEPEPPRVDASRSDIEALRFIALAWANLLRTMEQHRWDCELSALPSHKEQLAIVRAEHDAAQDALREAEGR